jgi:phosphohistidine phosphatase
MDLYLIRHGDAVPLGEQGIEDDAERPLTEIGHKQARDVGKGLRARDIKFDKIVTSPLVRARETAEEILKAWPEPAPELIVCDDLVPDGKPKRAARFIRDVKGERVGIVGHMPQLGVMAAWLIGGNKDTQIDLAKAGVAYVTCDTPRKGCGTLVWLVPPEWLS